MKLFIDDERDPPTLDFVIVRSSQAAIDYLNRNGVPRYISFDHDLGGDDTVRPIVNWLIDAALDGKIAIMPEFFVHSQNPVGRDWVIARMGDLAKIINGV